MCDKIEFIERYSKMSSEEKREYWEHRLLKELQFYHLGVAMIDSPDDISIFNGYQPPEPYYRVATHGIRTPFDLPDNLPDKTPISASSHSANAWFWSSDQDTFIKEREAIRILLKELNWFYENIITIDSINDISIIKNPETFSSKKGVSLDDKMKKDCWLNMGRITINSIDDISIVINQ